MVPASTDDPLAGPRFSHCVAQTLLQLGDRGSAVHAHIQQILTRAAEVHVGIIETRHDEPPAQIDDLRGRPRRFHDLIVPANSQKSFSPHRKSFRPGPRRIIGVNPRIAIDGDCAFRLRETRQSGEKTSNQTLCTKPVHLDFSEEMPEMPSSVRRTRFKPSSRPAGSYHS